MIKHSEQREQLVEAVKRFADVITSVKLCSILLYIIVGAWIVYRLIMATMLGRFFVELPFDEQKYLRQAMLAIVCYSELCRIWRGEYGKKDAIAIVLVVLLAWGFHVRGNIAYLYDTIAVFAMRHEDFRRLTWFGVIVLLGCTVITFVACAAGVVPDIVTPGSRVRHFLGFVYCLFGPQVLFTVTCAICWLLDGRMKWWILVLLLVSNVVLFILTDSRLSFVLCMAVIAIAGARKIWPKGKAWRVIAQIASWGFVIVAILGVVVVGVYSAQRDAGEHWLDEANAASGERILLTYEGVTKHGIEPFGQNVVWIGNGKDVYGNGDPNIAQYNYVDNLIFHSLIERGMVYTLGLIVLYTLAARKAVREKEYMLSIVLAVLAAHCFIDDLALQLCFNTLLFVCGSYLVTGASSGRFRNGRHAA